MFSAPGTSFYGGIHFELFCFNDWQHTVRNQQQMFHGIHTECNVIGNHRLNSKYLTFHLSFHIRSDFYCFFFFRNNICFKAAVEESKSSKRSLWETVNLVIGQPKNPTYQQHNFKTRWTACILKNSLEN